MTRREPLGLRIYIALLLLAVSGLALGTEQRFPPPEFTETQHQVPQEQYPPPRAAAVQ